MKFWQAALLSLLLTLCVGLALRAYAPGISASVCFGIGFIITAGAYALVEGKTK